MCNHKNLQADSEGFLVCTDCGKVMEQIYNYNYEDLSQKFSQLSFHPSKEHVLDILAHFHVYSESVATEVINLYDTIKIKIFQGTLIKKRDRDILAYSIWEIFNRMNSPRSPLEISIILEVNENSILNIEKHMSLNSTYCSPLSYVDRICANLYLPYYISKKVKEYIMNRYTVGFYKPETIIASTILLVIEEMRKEMNEKDFLKDFTVKYLSEALNISSVGIYKVKNELLSV